MTDSATVEDRCHQKKIFVGGLGHATTTQTLRGYFRRYGAIVDAVVLRWPDGRSRGFGYVTFAEAAAVTAALQETHKIAGSTVDVQRAVPGTNKLFVGGLPQNTPAAEMRQYFEHFGVVSDAVVMMDPVTNRSRGFGFVCFSPGQDGAAAVNTVLEQYNRHYIRGKWIEVKSAAPPRKLAMDSEASASPVSTTGDDTPVTPTLTSGSEETSTEPLGMGASLQAHFAPPFGLEAPPGLDLKVAKVGPCQGTCTQEAPRVCHVPQEARVSALPSLLATSQPFQWVKPSERFDAKGRAGLEQCDSMKVPLRSDLTTCTEGPANGASSIFDASMDLRRSLEQLLKLQSDHR